MNMNIPFPTPAVFRQSSHITVQTSSETANALPSHWQNNFASHWGPWIGRPLEFLFAGLCVVSIGRKSMHEKWQDLHSGDEKYKDHMDRLIYRMTSINTTIGLLLASMAALITTEPPKAHIINYTMRGPYICLWVSFGLLLGAAVVGSASLFIMSACTQQWTEKVLLASRPRVICILVTQSYPFLTVGLSTLLSAFGASLGIGLALRGRGLSILGLLSAAWLSEDAIAKKGCAFLLIFPLIMGILFVFCVFPIKGEEESGTDMQPLISPTRATA